MSDCPVCGPNTFFCFCIIVTAYKQSLGRLCFHRCLSVLGRGVSVGGCLCPEGSLSEEISVQGSLFKGVSVQGGLCPRDLCLGICVQGGLCPGDLCPRGSLSKGVSVHGGLCPCGSLSKRDFCPGKSLSREISVREGLCQGSTHPTGMHSRCKILMPLCRLSGSALNRIKKRVSLVYPRGSLGMHPRFNFFYFHAVFGENLAK